eukprot:3573934-Pyramimonas_sp.AAC.1
MECHAMLVFWYAMLGLARPCCGMQCIVSHCRAMPYCEAPWHGTLVMDAMHRYAMSCLAVQCNDVQCLATQCHTML